MDRIDFIWLRSLVRMLGFAAAIALFGITSAISCASTAAPANRAPALVQDEHKKPEAAPKEEPKPELPPEIAETFKTPLSAEGVVETKWSGTPLKVVILRVPLDDNWNDDPTQCLGSEAARKHALAFESVLEQQIDARPWLWRLDHPRVKRYSARLRFAGLDKIAKPGEQTNQAFAEIARTFNADVTLTLAYRRDGDSVRCHVWRYGRRQFHFCEAPLLAALGTENKGVVDYSSTAASFLRDIVSEEEEAALPPVPPLAVNDTALSHFVAMRECFDKGDLDGAWIEYSACLKADPKCGRAGLWGMEIFRNHASQTTPHKAVVEGIRGALATPNDVLLRGRMAYNAYVWFKQKEWALAALETALKAQPRRYELLMWKALILTDNDQQKMKAWVLENVLPHFKDGRAEVAIGNMEALSDKLGDAVEWYEKAVKLAPDDHEANFSLAIISTHHAEKLQRAAALDSSGDAQRERALKLFDRAVWAWNRCLEIDIAEQDMVLEFYVRAATRDYKYLPDDEAAFQRLFLIQAVRNGLQAGAGGVNFTRLAGGLLTLQQKAMREHVRAAKPEDADYELQLCARLNFAFQDNDEADAVFVLRTMRKRGYRGGIYLANAGRFQAQMDAADAKDKKDK